MSVLIPFAATCERLTSVQVRQELHSFREFGSVLHVAAHPDDENTQLIAYLARGRGLRTGYLSLTRGDGGQNALGPQLDEQLGIARTQELLAARRIDRGQQFFTRARDFGFSKNSLETLNVWGRQQVLADVVRVIRRFRPDVIITRFPPEPGTTHGHHTASAMLAVEAFKLAGDPRAFPEQLDELAPWQPKRVVYNGSGRGGTRRNTVQLDIAGEDPVSGEPFGTIAAQSLSMHKTQGLGFFSRGGGATGPRVETFELLAGEAMAHDIMGGIDATWNRVPGGAGIVRSAERLIARFDENNMAASVPALLKLREALAALPADPSIGPIVNEKRRQFDRILQACLGLTVQTTLPQAEVVAGESLSMHHAVTVDSNVPVSWIEVLYPRIDRALEMSIELASGKITARESNPVMPADSPLSQPYWLREESSSGLFRVDTPALIGLAQNLVDFPVEYVFIVGGQRLVVADEPVQAEPVAAEYTELRPLKVIPPATVRFGSAVELFAPAAARPIDIEIDAARAGVAGTLALDVPAGWKVTPANQVFRLKKAGDTASVRFTVTAPNQAATAHIGAILEVGGKRFNVGRDDIHYPHIPFQLVQLPARLKVVSLHLATRGRRVGYVAGAGDKVAQSIARMGYAVTELRSADLVSEKLRDLDAVVIGLRAFNVHKELAGRLPALLGFTHSGGAVIVQYNTTADLPAEPITPYPLQISRDRVTDENAVVSFLAPQHRALNTPNKISTADFQDWVQERGLYFPSDWDEHFTALLACNDPGEKSHEGGLLVARHGKGYFVYTGLAFFRQLPAGVPGAYRLFANLISLGRE